MASLVETLTEEMNALASTYEELLDLVSKKSQAIISNNVQQVQDLTLQENDVIHHLQTLDRKRMEQMNDLASILGIQKDFSLKDLIENLEARDAEVLTGIREKLLKTLEELDHVNKLNGELIKQSLEFIEFSLNSISSAVYDNSNYGNQENYNTNQTIFFDAKQ